MRPVGGSLAVTSWLPSVQQPVLPFRHTPLVQEGLPGEVARETTTLEGLYTGANLIARNLSVIYSDIVI